MDYKELISNKITKLRLSRNISSRALSFELGLSNSYITQIENKVKMPSIENLVKICEYFDITLADFFNDTDFPVKLTSEQAQFLKNLKSLNENQLSILNEFLKSLNT